MDRLDLVHRVRDPLYGFIRFSDLEKRLLDWPSFMRLRNVKQLALTCYVYPGAMHTRFEHSLGTMELATRAFLMLQRSHYQREQLKKCFKPLCFSLDDALHILRLAALLHDVGHLPFSHAAERLIDETHGDYNYTSHEDLTLQIIRDSEPELCRRGCSSESIRAVSSILDPDPAAVPPELRILRHLLSSQLDVDRIDYLVRDSLHCGVQYGNFDCDRLLDSLVTVPSARGGLELAISRGGVHVLEALILARYAMFVQVYFHRTRRIYDYYLARYMKARYGTSADAIKRLVSLDDADIINDMRICVAEGVTEADLYEPARDVLSRTHHSMVHETAPHDSRERRIAREIFDQLRTEFGDELVLSDVAEHYVHSFYVRHDEGKEKASQEFKVILKRQGREALLCDESMIIASLRRRICIERVYCCGGIEERERISDRAAQLRRDAYR